MENCAYNDTLGKNAEEQLHSLFNICDKKGKGYIVPDELNELCLGLGISLEDAEALFTDLDADQDGKISFVDFSSGFEEFLAPDHKELESTNLRKRASIWTLSGELSQLSEKESKFIESDETDNDISELGRNWSMEKRKRESVYHAWTSLTSSLVDSNLLSLSEESQQQVRQLYKELHCKSTLDQVAGKVEQAFASIMNEMDDLQKQKKQLEDLYTKEKHTHVENLRSLEVEIEDQVAKVEERAILKAKQQSQEEKQHLQDKLDSELAEMKAHLDTIQKVDSWFKKDGSSGDNKIKDISNKLTEANADNRSLQMNLQDSMSNMALMRSDLAQCRLQYEDKCKELHQEREQVLEYMHQYDHIKRQLDMLHNANQRLQDTNDSLREKNEYEWASPPYSKGSSARSSLRRLKKRSFSPPSQKNDQIVSSFGINRLMSDLDSGVSSQPDKVDEDQNSTELPTESSFSHEPLSLEEELRKTLQTNKIQGSREFYSASGDPATVPTILSHYKKKSSNSSDDIIPPSVLESRRSTRLSSIPLRSDSDDINFGDPDRTYKVVLAGNANVGKTTFIYRLCQGKFIPNLATTLGIDYKVKTIRENDQTIVVQLWDTAGQERYRSITSSYFRRADGILLFYDVTNEKSFTDIRHWIHSIEDSCRSHVPMMLCGNKYDMKDDLIAEKRMTIESTSGKRLADDCEAKFLEISCKTGFNVQEALIQLIREMVANEDCNLHSSKFQLNSLSVKNSCCFSRKRK